jgi:hypothetical protein
MKVNIYKDNNIFIMIDGENSLINFFKNIDNVKYTIEPNIKIDGRHILKYTLDNVDYGVSIGDVMAESILNEYKVELTDE